MGLYDIEMSVLGFRVSRETIYICIYMYIYIQIERERLIGFRVNREYGML